MPVDAVRTGVWLAALASLTVACTSDIPARSSEPATLSLVWRSEEGVVGWTDNRLVAFGGTAVGEFAWTPGGDVAVGVVAAGDGELVRWQPSTAALRTVACGGCSGAAVVGDEVRTTTGGTVRRFALPDLAAREPVDIASASDSPAEVLAATTDLTVVKRGEVLVGVENSGTVRWDYAAAGAIAPHVAIHPTGEEMAFAEVVASKCTPEHSEVTVLELATGRTRLMPRPVYSEEIVVRDLWWNGTDLVAPMALDCGGHLEHKMHFLVKGRWDRSYKPGDDVAFRTLPTGQVIRLSTRGELTRDGTLLGSGVTRLWSPTGRD